MKKIVRLTENDLTRLVKRVMNEQLFSHICLTNFETKESETFKGGGLHKIKTKENNDGIVIYWDNELNDWSNKYEKLLPNSGNSLPKKEIGRWKCVGDKFTTYDSKIQNVTYY